MNKIFKQENTVGIYKLRYLLRIINSDVIRVYDGDRITMVHRFHDDEMSLQREIDTNKDYR